MFLKERVKIVGEVLSMAGTENITHSETYKITGIWPTRIVDAIRASDKQSLRFILHSYNEDDADYEDGEVRLTVFLPASSSSSSPGRGTTESWYTSQTDDEWLKKMEKWTIKTPSK